MCIYHFRQCALSLQHTLNNFCVTEKKNKYNMTLYEQCGGEEEFWRVTGGSGFRR